jgi:hypothetical protein
MALSNSTFGDFGAAAQDIFAGQSDQAKAAGDFAEATEYNAAAGLALQNEQFTKQSTAIKEAQQQRELTMNLGQQQASTAGGGFAASGSSLDILRDSASQGALTHAVLGQQGLITEAGYQEQATSYQTMSQAAEQAGLAEDNAANNSDIMASINAMAGVASLFTGGGSNLLTGLFGDSGGFSPTAPANPNNPLVINQYGQAGDNPPPGNLTGLY